MRYRSFDPPALGLSKTPQCGTSTVYRSMYSSDTLIVTNLTTLKQSGLTCPYSNMNDDLKAEQSLCWKCKHGICVRESARDIMVPMSSEATTDSNDSWKPPEESQDGVPAIFEHDQVKAICFWKPFGVTTNTEPIIVANVKQCNRFEK